MLDHILGCESGHGGGHLVHSEPDNQSELSIVMCGPIRGQYCNMCVDQSNVSITTFGPISVEYYPMWWRVRFFLLLVWLVSYCWVTCQPIRCQYCNVWTNQRSVLPTPPRGTWPPPTAGSGCGTEGSSPSSLQQRVR